MKNYIIINGINSLNIAGLAINELPPIIKPLIRNIKEEIDGRNGDIITELGYSAYDKTITIGLYGNYDINNIISFFNQKGKIVFSNENDKYYNFILLSQIDFKHLLKFKTANVTFHCQPFKYPLNETPIELLSDGTVENVGNIYSTPTLKIEGTGEISIFLNDSQIFQIDMNDNDEIVIDTNNLEAYNPTTLELKNRDVIGNYDNFKLNVGINEIVVDGNFEKITITNYTRWI